MQNVLKLVTRFLGTALALFIASSAYASTISVYPLAADITASTRFQDLQVLNEGLDTAYVAIHIYRVNNPGMPDQSFTELADNPYQVGLIVTPNKMVIPTGQMRIARVLYISKSTSSDIIYEVKFTPVSGQLVTVGPSENQNVNAGVQVIISYGVAIFVRPDQLIPSIDAKRQGTDLALTNAGNTTVEVGNCKQCQGSNCTLIATLATTLYPKNVYHYTLPQDLPVTCTKEVLQNQFSTFTIK